MKKLLIVLLMCLSINSFSKIVKNYYEDIDEIGSKFILLVKFPNDSLRFKFYCTLNRDTKKGKVLFVTYPRGFEEQVITLFSKFEEDYIKDKTRNPGLFKIKKYILKEESLIQYLEDSSTEVSII